MKTFEALQRYPKRLLLLNAGIILAFLGSWFPVMPSISTMMHNWRGEFFSSIIFIPILLYLLLFDKNHTLRDLFKNPLKTEERYIAGSMFTFGVWCAFSGFWAFSPQSALYNSATWFIYLFVFLCVLIILHRKGSFQILFTLLALALTIIAIPAILEYASLLYMNPAMTLENRRFAKYAEIINLFSSLLLIFTLRQKGKRLSLGIFTVVVWWLFIFSTLSRIGIALYLGGLIFIGVVVFGYKKFALYRRRFLLTVVLIAASAVLLQSVSWLSAANTAPVKERFVSSEGTTRSNNTRMLLTRIGVLMGTQNWFKGVGAGNFGYEFNRYRQSYGKLNPSDQNLSVGESEIAERAHNEYLQIWAETGIVGLGILTVFFFAVVKFGINALRKHREISLIHFAVIYGLATFFISSVFSSYSFRLMQNGLAFFILLGIAARLFSTEKSAAVTHSAVKISESRLAYVLMLSAFIGSAAVLGIISVKKAASAFYVRELQKTDDEEQAAKLFNSAVNLDKENAQAYLFYALALFKTKKYDTAAELLRQSINYGETSSASYSLLATAYLLNQNSEQAENAMREALEIYPYSTFVRTRLAFLLEKSSKANEAAELLAASKNINLKSTNTWWSLMHEGVAKTNQKTLTQQDYLVVFDLHPQNSYMAFMIERLILFPEEAPKFDM